VEIEAALEPGCERIVLGQDLERLTARAHWNAPNTR
jgi:hypothetical protein